MLLEGSWIMTVVALLALAVIVITATRILEHLTRRSEPLDAARSKEAEPRMTLGF